MGIGADRRSKEQERNRASVSETSRAELLLGGGVPVLVYPSHISGGAITLYDSHPVLFQILSHHFDVLYQSPPFPYLKSTREKKGVSFLKAPTLF